MARINPSDITPEHIYFSRRTFLTGIGTVAAGALLASACGKGDSLEGLPTAEPSGSARAGGAPEEVADQPTDFKSITNYNNFYEFSLEKEDVAERARDFRTSPWTIEVGGLVNRPKTFDLDDLRRQFPDEERIYRMRCVEAWSIVVPWLGFPLSALLREVEPTSKARYVRFETLYDPQQMPGQKDDMFGWPYVEGLRLDEAMHDLTLLGTGIYGKPLLPQNGAPIRLVVPWKYGFKNIKSIVKIDLVAEMPVSFWMASAANEYGFYANVNPDVSHPRWSQSSERRLGETARRRTLLFNGYSGRVANLYEGMDLKKFF